MDIATQKPVVLQLKEKEKEARLRHGLGFSTLNRIRGSFAVENMEEIHNHLSGITKQIQVFATRVRICLNEIEVNVDYFSERKVSKCTTRVNGRFG